MTTNGTLLNQDRINFLKENDLQQKIEEFKAQFQRVKIDYFFSYKNPFINKIKGNGRQGTPIALKERGTLMLSA